MSNLSVLELMDIKNMISFAERECDEHIKNWYKLGLDTEFSEPVFTEYAAKCARLKKRLEEEIGKALEDEIGSN